MGHPFFGHPYGHLFSIIIVITTLYCKSNSSISFHFIHVLQFHPMSNLFHLCHQINPKSQFNCLINFIYIVVSFPCYQLHHVESSSLPSTALHSSFPSICLFHLGLGNPFHQLHPYFHVWSICLFIRLVKVHPYGQISDFERGITKGHFQMEKEDVVGRD